MKKQVLFAAILAGLLLASVVFAVARPKDEESGHHAVYHGKIPDLSGKCP